MEALTPDPSPALRGRGETSDRRQGVPLRQKLRQPICSIHP